MKHSEFSKAYHEKLFPGQAPQLSATDPEFVALFQNFALGEVIQQGDMDDRTRMTVILAALMGCQGQDEFAFLLPAALRMGVTPVEVKEMAYQAVAYLGIGRMLPFFRIINDGLTAQGIALPLEGQATTDEENRREAGSQAQADIFGAHMKDYWQSGPEETRHINYWLAANCFGDYYTRTGMDYQMRELITFCFLAAQGGCEPQLTSHAAANMRVGNDKNFLIQVVSQLVPYIGYPRCLNALNCVNAAAQQ